MPPKNPVRAARQASRQVIRTARTANRQDARTLKTTAKVDKIAARTATKVNKINDKVATRANNQPATKIEPKGMTKIEPKFKTAEETKSIIKSPAVNFPKSSPPRSVTPAKAPVKKSAPVKKKVSAGKPGVKFKDNGKPAQEVPKPAPAQKKGLADGSMSKNPLDYSAREIVEGAYNTGKAIKDEAYNKAKAIVEEAYKTGKRKAGYAGDAFDAGYNFLFKKHGGSVKKYQAGGMTTGMKPPRSIRGPKQSASDMRQPYGPSMTPAVRPGNTVRPPKAVRKAGPSTPASMMKSMKKGGTNKRK